MDGGVSITLVGLALLEPLCAVLLLTDVWYIPQIIMQYDDTAGDRMQSNYIFFWLIL